jgi:2-oxopent-4-enoate/cis-2-oxohex-4-enoate hydratase
MALRALLRRQLAERLVEAAASRVPVDAFSDDHPALTPADGYQVQREVLRLRRRAGDRRIGWKVGLTSAAARAELGMHEPIAGALLASSFWTDGAALPFDRFIAPAVEPEIAVVLGRDLAGPGVTALDALRATEAVAAGLEIVDSRFREWKCRIADAVADNAFDAGVVIGGRLTDPAGLDLRLEGVGVEQDGRLVATAAGAAALDHPLNAVAWLANHLAALSLGLRAGVVVLTGSLTRILRVQPGTHVRAAFTRLGAVGVRFV